ncbi:MAG: DNA polymerase III subunit [Candidatus Moranbacteria bacterium]|nr:DNA polymerase III subunit [Candidatus Moranbacteria bacterium]
MNIIGHKKQIDFLKKCLERDSVLQAYIFSGPEGVGKFLIAKNFARNIISGDSSQGGSESDRDFSCDVDEKIKMSPNFIFVSPQKKEKKGVTKESDISIDDVRDAQKKLSTFPSQGKFNVLIVNDAHKMNKSAQNALLKTLEEPNSSSIIILVTHRESNVLQTIKSRCNIVRFGTVTLGEIERELRESGVEDSNEISFFSLGRPGFAIRLKNDSELLSFRREEYKRFRGIFRADIDEKLEWAQESSKNVNEAVERLELWIWFLRVQAYQNISDEKKVRLIYDAISKIEESTVKMKETNASSRLILENLLMSF